MIEKRRATIATETPVKELSPHYATKLEKQAFSKIKEWKEGFAIRLDEVLKQRQLHKRNVNNTEKTKEDECATASLQPVPPSEGYSVNYTPNTPKNSQVKHVPPINKDPQKQVLLELTRVSEISVRNTGDLSGYDTGSKILQEIKKQRRNSNEFGNHKLMEELSSWHIGQSEKITNDLFTNSSDVKDVRLLLSSLKETIDAIFINTIQRVTAFDDSSETDRSPSRGNDFDKINEKALLRSDINNVKEERDRLFAENISLRKQIEDFQRRLDKLQTVAINLASVENDLMKLDGLEKLKKLKYIIAMEELQPMDKRIAIRYGKEGLLFHEILEQWSYLHLLNYGQNV